MAKERKASVIYEGNASQLVYAFPFDYLRKKFVKVEDIYTNITELTIGVDYTIEDKQVRLVKGIPLGHSVKIYRETTTDPLVEWQDASVLRSADLSLQEVQLLHLAEETSDRVFDSGMSTAYGNPNCWDGQYKRIINALDPIEDGDVVTLRFIKANQSSLLNAIKSEGAKQVSSVTTTGTTQVSNVTNEGDKQVLRVTNTGDTQNNRVTTTGDNYVSTMTTLKDTATTKANDASASADLAKKWAMSSSSPDGVNGNKSAKTWAEEAKTSASNSATSASASQSSATASASSASNASNSANASKQSASASANSASAAASSASAASTSASNAKTSETNAANSAKAAKQSEENSKTWDPSSYYKKTEIDSKALLLQPLLSGTETNYKSFDIPKQRGMFSINYGTPDGLDGSQYKFGLITNFKGASDILTSLYVTDKHDTNPDVEPEIYIRSGYANKWHSWSHIVTNRMLYSNCYKKSEVDSKIDNIKSTNVTVTGSLTIPGGKIWIE